MFRNFGGDGGIVRRIGHHGDAFKIFRRRADHRRSADVNIFDQLLRSKVRLRGSGFEGIEIDHNEIDGRDFVFGCLLAITRIPAPEQNSAMHFRVQSFDSPAEHFGPSSQFGNIAHGNPSLTQQARSAPRRNNLDAERGELPGKFSQSALVINTQQRALHRHKFLRKSPAKRAIVSAMDGIEKRDLIVTNYFHYVRSTICLNCRWQSNLLANLQQASCSA